MKDKQLRAMRKWVNEREKARIQTARKQVELLIPGYNDYIDQALCGYAREWGGDDLLDAVRAQPVALIPLLWKAWQFDGKADSIGTPQANPGLEDER